MHLAANEGHVKIFEFLLMEEANFEAKTTLKRTPLHIACLRGNLSIVKLLIDSGADINASDKDFNTALHYVSELGFTNIIKFLMQKKPDYRIKNHARLTAMDVALNSEVIKIFDSFGVINEELVSSFGRTCLNGTVLFMSRSDLIGKLIHSVNK